MENHVDLHLGVQIALSTPPPALTDSVIHLWVAELEQVDTRILANILSTIERERAQRFYFKIDRQRFIARRGLLHILLGAYLELPPDKPFSLAALRLMTNPHGKPALDVDTLHHANALADRLRFNISHSDGIALFAFALDHEVGVDIERVRQEADANASSPLIIADRFFSPLEQQALRTLPPEQQTPAFFNCWTRKEAYIKAQGQGLSLPLDEFDVSLTPGEPARLIDARHAGAGPAGEWTLFNLSPAPGYSGALAIHGLGWQMQTFDLRVA